MPFCRFLLCLCGSSHGLESIFIRHLGVLEGQLRCSFSVVGKLRSSLLRWRIVRSRSVVNRFNEILVGLYSRVPGEFSFSAGIFRQLACGLSRSNVCGLFGGLDSSVSLL